MQRHIRGKTQDIERFFFFWRIILSLLHTLSLSLSLFFTVSPNPSPLHWTVYVTSLPNRCWFSFALFIFSVSHGDCDSKQVSFRCMFVLSQCCCRNLTFSHRDLRSRWRPWRPDGHSAALRRTSHLVGPLLRPLQAGEGTAAKATGGPSLPNWSIVHSPTAEKE